MRLLPINQASPARAIVCMCPDSVMISAWCLLACFFLAAPAFPQPSISADPDRISTGVSWSGVGQVKVGDRLTYKNFSVGGMVVIRNEKRFNQGILPNHNWRGFVTAGYICRPGILTRYNAAFETAVEHESAHPTMGIREEPQNAFQSIYDGVYRRYMLNSLLMSLHKEWDAKCFTIDMQIGCQLYVFSKNTPELATLTTGVTHGFSVGGEIGKRFETVGVYVAVFDRYIFQGAKEDRGDLYIDSVSGIVKAVRAWPVLNQMHTFVIKTGCEMPVMQGRSMGGIYLSYLSGNIFGFVDSREKRTVWRVGVEFSY